VDFFGILDRRHRIAGEGSLGKVTTSIRDGEHSARGDAINSIKIIIKKVIIAMSCEGKKTYLVISLASRNACSFS
jgi:hypothetical protein